VQSPLTRWGGDAAPFHANGGGHKPTEGLFARQGYKGRLYREDDFSKQIAKYKKGESPFLRGTFSMFAQAADELNQDKKTRPVIFLQLTWSAGDHLVVRDPKMALLTDLRPEQGSKKKKRIALHDHAPHLATVGRRAPCVGPAGRPGATSRPGRPTGVRGKEGPAEKFRNDLSVDACFAITPEMMELTGGASEGGVDKSGDGTKGSVKNAHVLV